MLHSIVMMPKRLFWLVYEYAGLGLADFRISSGV